MKVISRLRDLKMSISATSVHIYFVYMNEASQVTDMLSMIGTQDSPFKGRLVTVEKLNSLQEECSILVMTILSHAHHSKHSSVLIYIQCRCVLKRFLVKS